MSIEIKEIVSSEEEIYNEFLSSTRGALFYHTLKYRNFLQSLLSCQSHYLIAMENGKIIGALPLMIKKGKFGSVVNSLPFYGSHGGIISDRLDAHLQLQESYFSIISNNKICCATYIENPFSPFNYPLKKEPTFSDYRISQVTNLGNGTNQPSDLIKVFDSSTRRNLNKAKREGLSVIKDSGQFDFLYETHVENMNLIGGRSKSKRFFDLVPQMFSEGTDYDLYVALSQGKPICALLVFYYNGIVEYFIPVIKSEFRSTQPLTLVVCEAMLEASSKGFERWNWGGTWKTQDGVYKFKKKWGSIDKEYQYHINLMNSELLNSSPEELLNEYGNFYTVPFAELKGVNDE